MEKSPLLNWATLFLRWHTLVRVSLMFLSEWREFPSTPCLAEKKKLHDSSRLDVVEISMLLKSRTSPEMLPFSLCNKKKTCNSAHEQTPLSNDTIDFVLRHRELGRAKDLSAPILLPVCHFSSVRKMNVPHQIKKLCNLKQYNTNRIISNSPVSLCCFVFCG